MFAVIKSGSSQYRVSEGDVIAVDLEAEKDKEVDLEVLLYADGDDIRVGQPLVSNVKVKAKAGDPILGDKKFAFKFRRRKDSSTRRGHRQKMTLLTITKIAAQKG